MCSKENELSKAEIIKGFGDAGIKKGGVVFVHAAMRTFGRIQGGAGTVVNALLEMLGPKGTLVVPTFTFKHEAEESPVIDPRNDKSEMGAISEAVRLYPEAFRSIAFRHSVAAIGRRARVITEVDPKLSPFDLRSSFGVMLALNTQVLLLGVTYSSSTSHHFAEWVCDVSYRHTIPLVVKVRNSDGSVVRQEMVDYQPKPSGTGTYYGSRHTDFNRLGRMLEERGLVSFAAIGNAAVRLFALRDLIDLAQIEAEKDCNIFRTDEGRADYFTPLDFGEIVLSNEMRDGAGRANCYQWCVVSKKKLKA